MMTGPLSLKEDYWETFELQESDFQFLYNHLLELETPLTPEELLEALIIERINIAKVNLQNQQQSIGKIYQPKEQYAVGDSLLFPSMGWHRGEVTNFRPGKNPELPHFDVIEVTFDNTSKRQFATGLVEHKLNQPISFDFDNPDLKLEFVREKYGSAILIKLNEQLETHPDLVRIAGRWFPRSLLVDVNIGYLNLAEALLDMETGGPMTTSRILEQIELPTDVNLKLTEFSLNLALQEDGRFDEVGPVGEVQWFLHRLEPDSVQNVPIFLRYKPISYDPEPIKPLLEMFQNQITDELEPNQHQTRTLDELSFELIFPHWRSGTLPFTEELSHIFPSALESQRIKFTFRDRDTGKTFPGWVIRPDRYVYGLREWYNENEIMPGSIIHVRRGNSPGIVEISSGKKRSSREWVRTALIGADGGIVFAMLKQLVGTTLDERMSIAIPDHEALDQFWEGGNRQHSTLDKIILSMMAELAKLTPQGHVHAQELYAAVNLLRRCPPGPILSVLFTQTRYSHLGDLYFRLNEDIAEGTNNS